MRWPQTPLPVETPNGTLLVSIASTFAARSRGLLFTSGLDQREALLILPCSAIHTIGMRYAIDALFVDEQAIVIARRERLPPWRLASFQGARAVLEMAAGAAEQAGLRPGEVLRDLGRIVGRR